MRAGGIRIGGNSLNRMQQSLSLRKGQVVKAQVMDVHGSKIVLKIGTVLLNGESQVPLQQGETLRLTVEGVADKLVKLKISPEEDRMKPESIMLARLGIKPRQDLENMVQQLLRFRMPVDAELLNSLSTMARLYDLPQETLLLVVWLKSLGVAVTSEEDVRELKNLARFFKGELSETEEERFFSFLNRSETTVLGGYNLYGWPLDRHHLYLLTSRSKKERLAPENCTLILKVASRVLGDLWFKINYLDSSLRVSVTCVAKECRDVLQREIGLLQQGLQAAGYQVGQVDVKVRDVQTVFDFIPGPDREIAGVNFKV